RIELESHHPRHDQREAKDSNRAGRLAVAKHSNNDPPDRPTPGPHRIGRTERKRLERNRDQSEAEHDRGQGRRGRPDPGEPIGIFQAECPGDLKQARRKKCKPCAHGFPGSGASVSTAYWAYPRNGRSNVRLAPQPPAMADSTRSRSSRGVTSNIASHRNSSA